MQSANRRQLVKYAGAVAATGAVMSHNSPVLAQEDITLQWWDHYAPLEGLLQEIFDAYSAETPNVTVEHTLYNLPELGQSLQLAFNSDQAPDVHAIASLMVPTARLVDEGWFTPIEGYVSEGFLQRFPEATLLDGVHRFDGELYSFPLFSFRSHSTTTWFNRMLVEEAGVDPEVGPVTWDEFRQTAASITENGGGQVFGWIQAIGLPERLGTQVIELAQMAGSPGEIDWLTGEYMYHTEPFLQAIEFLTSMEDDGSLFPASTTLDARTARARFSTGTAGLNFDGPWSIGVIVNDYPEFADQVNAGQIPVPDLNNPGYVTRGPVGGDFWISSQSEHPEIGAAILEGFNTPEFYVRLAERMDQPPLDLGAVEEADVHPAYQNALAAFEGTVRLAPVPEARNSDVSEVLSRMTDIRPNLGEIVQGVFSGDTADIATALQDYSDELTVARDRAIAAAQDEGFEVSVDDWVFSNWELGTDYTSEQYQ